MQKRAPLCSMVIKIITTLFSSILFVKSVYYGIDDIVEKYIRR